MLDRRQFLGVMLMSKAVLAKGESAIALPPPDGAGTVPLLQALRLRVEQRIALAQTVGYAP